MHIVWLSWKDHAHPLAGGAELVKAELAKRLAADGHQVTIITDRYPGSATQEQYDGYTIVRVPNWLRLGVYWNAWRYYRRHYTQTPPDIVIDEINTVPFLAFAYARPRWKRQAKPRVVVFAHQLARQIWFHEMFFPLSLVGYLLEPVYLWLMRRQPAIVVSESSKQDLCRFGFNPEQVFIIPEGITMQPADSIGVKTNQSMLVLGAIRSMKQTLHAVQAFEIAKAKLPNLKLDIAGAPLGAYGQKVSAYVAASRYAADITLHGSVTPAQKQLLMRQTNIIVSTALKEGWGLTISEAASQGALPVVYDVDGLRDAVYRGKGGVLAKPQPAAMADAIVDALTNDHTAERQFAYQQSKKLTFDRSYEVFLQHLITITQLPKA